MTWFNGFVLYLIIWWTLLFAVLPWGNHASPKDERVKGQADSAPAQPRLKQKVIANTILSTVVWGIAYVVIIQLLKP
ncbi:MAG: DUF1467 family protein [Pseudomonadota bacterium]